MPNLPNRSNYGNLSCLYAVWKSRYNKKENFINIKDLKFDKRKSHNTIDYCTGAINFDNSLIEQRLNRKKYCPFVDDRNSEHVCNFVYSVDSDSQKSKPVGQAALMLAVFDFANLIYTNSGVNKSIIWNNENSKILNLNWGDKKLNEYLVTKILEFGPIVGLIQQIKKNLNSNNEFNKSVLSGFLGFPNFIINQNVGSFCANKNCKNKLVNYLIDIGSSNDSKIRSLKPLINLLAYTTVIKPLKAKDKIQNTIIDFDDWLFKEGNYSSFPTKWYFDDKKLSELNFYRNNMRVIKTIEYRNLVQKKTHRNSEDRCNLCEKNIINNFFNKYESVLKYRRLLLIKLFISSSLDNKNLNKKSILNFFLKRNLFLSKSYSDELDSELNFLNLIGIIFSENKNCYKTLNDISELNLGTIDSDIIKSINKDIEMFDDNRH